VQKAYAAKAFASRWKALRAGEFVVLDHVAREAWPFAAALAVKAAKERRVWIVCPDARTQEQIHGELFAWDVPSLFFPRLAISDAGSLPDPDTQAERVGTLSRFSSGDGSRVIVVCEDSLNEEVPSPKDLESRKKLLETGTRHDIEALVAEFEASGYERAPVVTERGQYARRGGILDVYSWQGEEPLRIEFFVDEIESLRAFDLHTQTSVRRFDRVSILLQQQESELAALVQQLAEPAKALVVPVNEQPWNRPGWCDAEGRCWFCNSYSMGRWNYDTPPDPAQDWGRLGTVTHSAPHWAIPRPGGMPELPSLSVYSYDAGESVRISRMGESNCWCIIASGLIPDWWFNLEMHYDFASAGAALAAIRLAQQTAKKSEET
jgi:hypothetical protein